MRYQGLQDSEFHMGRIEVLVVFHWTVKWTTGEPESILEKCNWFFCEFLQKNSVETSRQKILIEPSRLKPSCWNSSFWIWPKEDPRLCFAARDSPFLSLQYSDYPTLHLDCKTAYLFFQQESLGNDEDLVHLNAITGINWIFPLFLCKKWFFGFKLCCVSSDNAVNTCSGTIFLDLYIGFCWCRN